MGLWGILPVTRRVTFSVTGSFLDHVCKMSSDWCDADPLEPCFLSAFTDPAIIDVLRDGPHERGRVGQHVELRFSVSIINVVLG
jgi:hypothetical protein